MNNKCPTCGKEVEYLHVFDPASPFQSVACPTETYNENKTIGVQITACPICGNMKVIYIHK